MRLRLKRWNWALYAIMVFIVAGLLWLLYQLSAIQASQSPERRLEAARRLVAFQAPKGYLLTSALYTLHPRFFVLTRPETGQRIRVTERRWWAKARTPEEFREKFWHPGRWVEHPAGFGYSRLLVEATGELEADSLPVPYAIGTLDARRETPEEKALVACLYDAGEDRSIYVFATAPAEVFSPTEVIRFTSSLAPVKRAGEKGDRSIRSESRISEGE